MKFYVPVAQQLSCNSFNAYSWKNYILTTLSYAWSLHSLLFSYNIEDPSKKKMNWFVLLCRTEILIQTNCSGCAWSWKYFSIFSCAQILCAFRASKIGNSCHSNAYSLKHFFKYASSLNSFIFFVQNHQTIGSCQKIKMNWHIFSFAKILCAERETEFVPLECVFIKTLFYARSLNSFILFAKHNQTISSKNENELTFK